MAKQRNASCSDQTHVQEFCVVIVIYFFEQGQCTKSKYKTPGHEILQTLLHTLKILHTPVHTVCEFALTVSNRTDSHLT